MSQLPPLTATALAALLTATNAFAGVSINALGDSITSAFVFNAQFNHPTYQAQLAALPPWAQGTAYVPGNLVKSGGYVYRCTVAGTAGATAPTGTAASGISDGGATWAAMPTLNVQKGGQHMLAWAEWYNPRLKFDQTLGYGGLSNSLLKVIPYTVGASGVPTAGPSGTGYSPSDTVAFNNGAAGTLVVDGQGRITGVTVTNPGYQTTGSFTATITTSTGSGALLSMVQGGSGTFSVPGCRLVDVALRVADVIAARPSMIAVHAGTNDAAGATRATLNASVAAAWACLKYTYDSLLSAGIKVVAVPVTPRASSTTPVVRSFIAKLNRMIRGYCAQIAAFNTAPFTGIALADPTKYWTDGTSNGPVGGSGGVAYAATVEGLHNASRGAQYSGYTVAKAVERWIGGPDTTQFRGYGSDDGYDSLLNPGGNMLEGADWATHFAGLAAVIGQQCSNGTGVYTCVTAGTCAASGGPTGTGANVSDGTAKWTYTGPANASIFAAGSAGTLTAVSGVTSGAVATGYTLSRTSGSATGSVAAAVESPWSNGQAGQRQSIVFSLGGGTANERWDLFFAYGNYGPYANRGIQASDLGVTPFTAEVDIELSGLSMMTRCNLFVANADTDKSNNFAGPCLSSVGYEMIPTADASVKDPLATDLGGLPNGGRMRLVLGPFILPPNLVNFTLGLSMSFNASGAAGTALGTVKVNRFGLHKFGVA